MFRKTNWLNFLSFPYEQVKNKRKISNPRPLSLISIYLISNKNFPCWHPNFHSIEIIQIHLFSFIFLLSSPPPQPYSPHSIVSAQYLLSDFMVSHTFLPLLHFPEPKSEQKRNRLKPIVLFFWIWRIYVYTQQYKSIPRNFIVGCVHANSFNLKYNFPG